MRKRHRKNRKKLSQEKRKSAEKVEKMCRGFETEDKLFESLNKFKRRRKKFINNRSILSIERTAHYSIDDKNGKDFIVKFKRKGEIEEISIQVKNWMKSGMKKMFKKKGICFICIPTNNNDPDHLIFRIINNYLRRKDEADALYRKKTEAGQIIACQRLSIFSRMVVWVKNFWENCKLKIIKRVSL